MDSDEGSTSEAMVEPVAEAVDDLGEASEATPAMEVGIDSDNDEENGEEVIAVEVVADDDGDDDDGSERELGESAEAAVIMEDTQSTASSTKREPARPSKKKNKGKAPAKVKSEDGFEAKPECVEAASDAKAMLQDMVESLPAPFGEIQVRSFGRVYVESNRSNKETKYSTASQIFPIGFSCDRFEFSPVHGRVLKLRCSILDGVSIKKRQKRGGFPVSTTLADGPVFRIVWGMGVDEEVDGLEGSFDPDCDAPFYDVLHPNKRACMLRPKVGMHVRVRFNDKDFYGGIIEEVETVRSSSSKNGSSSPVDITIAYYDGSRETIKYPDVDVTLLIPGTERELDDKGSPVLTEWAGKPVNSVVANSPLEAWGEVLTKIGLIDEIMLTTAMEAVELSRQEALQEARDKMEGKQKVPSKTRSDRSDDASTGQHGEGNDSATAEVDSMAGSNKGGAHDDSPTDAESVTEEERELRSQVEELESELSRLEDNDHEASVALANSRIALLGRFLCNPFHIDSSGKSQQASWLATAVRKEKSRMGSTGNRKKIVTAVDLLERNDSLYTPDIEALIEGLPGSEYCRSYIFQAFRSGGSGSNRAWILEAQLREEKEAKRRMKKSQEIKEREQEKETQEMEREKKRRKKEEFRDARKRQKLEEEEEKKKARIEERLTRLKVQVDDRLFKEASAQREKVVTSLARTLGKEFVRRRKAAEVVAAHSVSESKHDSESENRGACKHLPALHSRFDEDAVRVWDFISTFRDFFLRRSYIAEIPSLDSLQDAINCIRQERSGAARDDAVAALTDLALALCRPLAASLTRVLFASLIALNPTLQKDFGAAFFNEVNSVEENSEGFRNKMLIPINKHTWREVARQALLADALAEVGMQRHEAAHALRGYRSAGHPNSKEARRLRRAEEFNVSLLRQTINESRYRGKFASHVSITRVDIPCTPLSDPSDFRFYLYSVTSSNDVLPSVFKDRLGDAIRILDDFQAENRVQIRNEVQKVFESIAQLGSSDYLSKGEAKLMRKAKDSIKRLLKDFLGNSGDGALDSKSRTYVKIVGRHQMGMLKALGLESSRYKKLVHTRENYMEEALRLKQKLNNGKANEEEDDDEDDYENAEVVETGTEGETAQAESAEKEVPSTQATKEDEDAKDEQDDKGSVLDEFFQDIPGAPELIRRCLAVLRTLSATGCAEPFLYPVDPQSNPAYYDSLVRPMCLREVGKRLREGAEVTPLNDEHVEKVVADFARNIRLIGQNCLSYANAGPTVVAAGAELQRIFERLLLDWVLAPDKLLPAFDSLDDDRCVVHHVSDAQSTVLLCDGCEGKYNIARLDPPLREIPKGDWYCPRCVKGRWWGSLDPRVGKEVLVHVENKQPTQGGEATPVSGTIRKVISVRSEDGYSQPSLGYVVKYEEGNEILMTLEEIDKTLADAGEPVPRIKCLEAVAESIGYGFGVDHGLRHDLVPVPTNPNVSEAAAQVSLSSSVFRDTIAASGTLLMVDPHDMNSREWLRLLVLLAMKCASSDVLQALISKMEGEAAEKMSVALEKVQGTSDMLQILPPLEDLAATEDVFRSQLPDGITSAGSTHSSENSSDTRRATVDAKPMVVEVNAVEIVSEVNIQRSTEEGSSEMKPAGEKKPDVQASAQEVPLGALQLAMAEKKRRQKVCEDSFAAYSIKNQIRSSVASFKEDTFSPLVDSLMSSRIAALSFASLRCRGVVCDFCGMTDVALGSPLVRVPDARQWNLLVPHSTRSRKTHLIAEIETQDNKPNKLIAVKVTINDEMFSIPAESDHDGLQGGILDFAPRSEGGFQDELKFRYEFNLPFVSGSLSAHECCAIAAHNARKDLLVQRFKEKEALRVENEFGMTCARTLRIGQDNLGRSYWKFFSDQDSLFVLNEGVATKDGNWNRYKDSASIASVVVSLGRCEIASEIKRAFPAATQLLRNGLWSDLLMKRRFPNVAKLLGETQDQVANQREDLEEIEVEGGFEPYRVGEKVLVEAKSGRLLWDAQILSHSMADTDLGKPKIVAYQVKYTEWSSRFVEWVAPKRVMEPSENDLQLQEERYEENTRSSYGLPVELNYLLAKDFLFARERARGKDPIPDFARLYRGDVKESSDARIIRLMKIAILAIEAALPIGSIDNRESGPWRRPFAEKWKHTVEGSEGPEVLIRCAILLEDTISTEWIKEDIGHLRACLPARWKATGEASASALALRIMLLDKSIMYEQIDRKRYSSRKRRR